jgi:hypothetical protein
VLAHLIDLQARNLATAEPGRMEFARFTRV